MSCPRTGSARRGLRSRQDLRAPAPGARRARTPAELRRNSAGATSPSLAATVRSVTERGPDVLSPDARRALLEAPRPRHLPIAPEVPPGRRRLPLADEARPIDKRAIPIYVVWEVTLKCDLACRHCGSRAGRERPDELTTAECLDLVYQMADLGTLEVKIIGGEAYLRDDWAQIAKQIRELGVQCTMTARGRGVT